DLAAAEDPIDGRVDGASTADLGEDGRGDPDQRLLLVRDAKDGACAVCQDRPLARPCERIERVGVENQRLRQATFACASAFACTGPSSSSSSSRKTPSCSRSSSWRIARATNPERPLSPTRLRTVSARSPGTLTDSFATPLAMPFSYHGRKARASIAPTCRPGMRV